MHVEKSMSCYNWEEGTIKLPSAAYVPFRKAFLAAVMAREALEFGMAQAVIERIRSKALALPEGRTLDHRVQAVLLDRAETAARSAPQYELFDAWQIARVVSHDTPPPDPTKPKWNQPALIPRKSVKALRKNMLAMSNGKTRHFYAHEAEVTFADVERTVTWSVSENNHAVERAREGFLGRTLFAMLSKVQWTRGSGGEIAGNDEYSRDARGSGQGCNYVTARYGPASAASQPGRVCARRF